MNTITLFEHQKRAYIELGWSPDHPGLEGIEQINETAGVELVQLTYKHLKATQFVGVICLPEVTIQILPKIDYDPLGDPDAPQETRRHQIAARSAMTNLLHLLSCKEEIKIRKQDAARLLARRPGAQSALPLCRSA